jgi:hypothetical protein
MKIKDLSFIAEVTEENTGNVNGGTDNPFANVGYHPAIEQALANSQYISDIIWNNYFLNQNSMDIF